MKKFNFIPNPASCYRCKNKANNCSGLNFKSMKRICRVSSDTVAVICPEFKEQA